MDKITLKLLLKKKVILKSFFILCSIFIFENMFSRKHWDPSFLEVYYQPRDHSIYLGLTVIDYEFGPFGEHGYCKEFKLSYSLNSEQFEGLLCGTIQDQTPEGLTWINLSNKLKNAEIVFSSQVVVPQRGTIWPENSDIRVAYENYLKKSYFCMGWRLPPYFKVTDIELSGEWHVNGLNCYNHIFVEKYPIKAIVEPELKTDSNRKRLIDWVLDCPENNTVRVYNESDAVVVKGAGLGENIQVYSTSRAMIKQIVASDVVVKIKLPANQVYIVNAMSFS